MNCFIVFGNAPYSFNTLVDFINRSDFSGFENVYIQAGFSKDGIECKENFFLSEYFSEEDYNYYLSISCCFVGHAGVGFINNVLDCGFLPKVLPRRQKNDEHIDDHQLELYETLLNLGFVDGDLNLSPNLKSSAGFKYSLPVDMSFFDRKKMLCVSSIGGHRTALIKTLDNNQFKVDSVDYLHDECNFETRIKYHRFPSCNIRYFFPIRILQAVLFLRRNSYNCIYTTGAGVGFVFCVAGYFLGIPVVIQDSLTRIKRESLWFKLSYHFSYISLVSPLSKTKLLRVKRYRL